MTNQSEVAKAFLKLWKEGKFLLGFKDNCFWTFALPENID
jgi:predicted metal-dependent peptidase